jgi:hypothetical protein
VVVAGVSISAAAVTGTTTVVAAIGATAAFTKAGLHLSDGEYDEAVASAVMAVPMIGAAVSYGSMHLSQVRPPGNMTTGASGSQASSGQNLKPNQKPGDAGNTVVSSEMETKILDGQRIEGSNRVIGGHSPKINNANPNYAVQEMSVNPDGTKVVKFTTQFSDGNLAKIKTSTLFPDSWSDKNIIESVKTVGNTSAVGIRDNLTLHRGTINGVQIDVIKDGANVISGYPTGGKLTPGFTSLK